MRYLVLLAMIAGCAGGEDEPDPGPPAPPPAPAMCQPRQGLYRVTYTAKSGNCGPVDPSIVNIGGPASMMAGMNCTGMGLAPDQCRGTVELVCVVPGVDMDKLAMTGSLSWAADGSSGSGEIFMELRSRYDRILCSGIYLIRYTRQ